MRRGRAEDARELVRGYTGLFVGLTLAGLTCLGWGASLGSGTAATILIGLGGAVLGTSTAALLATLNQADFLAETHAILSRSLAPGLVSDEAAIEEFRRKFYWYSVSQMDGKRYWRHSVIDFSNSTAAGRLTTEIPAKNRRGALQHYRCHAGFVDERFIHINKANRGREPSSVYVYPSLGKDFYEVHCGFGLKESWDGTQLLVPSILSTEPVLHELPVGNIDDPDVIAHLNRAWQDGFGNSNVLEPVEAEYPLPVALPDPSEEGPDTGSVKQPA